MTIYEIKRRTADTSPHFFDRAALKFFGQTLKSFKVFRIADGRTRIMAPILIDGRRAGETIRFFNPINNKLERE
jgi:hypothetical protein